MTHTRPRDTPTHPLIRGRVHPHPTRQRASDVWLHRFDRIGGSWPLAMLRPAADPRRAGPRLWEATCRGWAMGYRSPSLHRRRAGRCHVPPPTIRASARGESVVHSGRWPPDGFARPIRGHGGAVRSLWAGVDLGGLRFTSTPRIEHHPARCGCLDSLFAVGIDRPPPGQLRKGNHVRSHHSFGTIGRGRAGRRVHSSGYCAVRSIGSVLLNRPRRGHPTRRRAER